MKRFLPNKKGFFALLLALCLGMGTAYASYDFSAVCNGKTLYFNIIDESNHYVELTCPGAWGTWWEGYDKPTGNITLPSSVTYNGVTYTVKEIGIAAFYECTGLTGSLTIPNSVTRIDHDAFYGCNGFTGTLTLSNSVTWIDNWAFGRCRNFSGSLTIPDLVTHIGNYAFDWCDGFTGTLTLGNSLVEIGEGAFESCNNLTGELILPNSLTTIGYAAFLGCRSMTGTLTIPNSVTTIGIMAFHQCTGFTGSLTIPNSVTSIGESAFESCTGFTGTLAIGKYVTSIGRNAFKDCTGFTHLNYNAIHCADLSSTDYNNVPFKNFSGTLSIGDEVQRIPKYMFYGCSGFTGTLTIPSSVTSIGYGAFYQCTHFTSLYLGNSLTTIDYYAFYNCYRMTGTLIIPESVTTIEYAAFADCYGFSSLTIGSNVTTIGNNAFSYCSGLGSMTVRAETPPTLSADGSFAFDLVSMDIPVYVPCGSLSDYQAAYGWSNFTNYQCIPWTVTLSANPGGGGYADFTDNNGSNGHYSNGATCSVLATPQDNYLFMHWSKNGTVVSSNLSYSFNVYEDTNLEAVFMALSDAGNIIGTGTNTSSYLPSHSLYNYSLTEQIYTSTELEGITTITSISFFNAGAERTRLYDVYLVNTDKASFNGGADWIPVYQADCVFTGYVTMRRGMWTTIVLDTPFAYNGTSNLVLVVDDNTGAWEGSMSCRTYTASGNQAIRIYSDGTNYNPASPSSYTGSCVSQKNQIMLNRQGYNIAATSANETAGTVSGGGQYGQGDLCCLKATPNTGYTFLSWSDTNGTVITTEAEYSFFVTENRTLVANFLTGTDVCSLTFDLYDSYGDGWNGNYLVVDLGDGVSQRLTVTEGFDATYTLPVVNGSHVELNWIQGSYAYECFFKVRYSNESIVFVSIDVDLNSNFEYGFDVDCDEKPANWAFLGYDDNGGSEFLPSYSYYNYSLTQQIYTAAEIGTAGAINSIAFYNENYDDDNTKTRTYDIYLKATDKNEFFTDTDWISVTEDDKVFSGEVTMTVNKWTLITFDIPFEYDGTSNLALIVDDNTGGWTSAPHMSCRTYYYNGDNQAIYVYSDDTNYDPNSPSAYNGTLMNEKNQVYFGFTDLDCMAPLQLNATDITEYAATLNWTGYQGSYNLRYRTAAHYDFSDDFENGYGSWIENWTLIDADGDGHNWHYNTTFGGHNGSTGFVFSESYSSTLGVLTPDNYLVSPQVTLDGVVQFWACAQDANWAAEHFGVAVSTTGNTDPADFTTIQEWTMTAKAQGNWYQYTADLSAYAGQTGYVAIRHFNCTDMFYLDVDDVNIGTYAEEGDWVEMTVTGNSVDVTGLTPNTPYEWQVQGINASCSDDGLTEWSEVATFTTLELVSITRTFALNAGLNWFSTNIEITLEDLQAALVATGNTSIMIASQSDGKTTYANGRWRGQLSTLDVKQMYKITVGTACEMVLEGTPINPAEHPVTIHNGSNWIGFPLRESMALTDAFAGFAANGDMVVSQSNGSATYTGGRWRGALTTLEPGQGYNYKSASSAQRILTFPTPTHDYVDLGLPSGLLWATCNVGATAPEGYGDYFAWGETQPKDYYGWTTYQHCMGGNNSLTKYCNNSEYGYNGFTDNLTTLKPSDDAATANWGAGWRMPTDAEFQELYNNTTVTWTTQNGVNGRLFTASNGNSLFLPAAGDRGYSSLNDAGSLGNYWTSSLFTGNPPDIAKDFYFDSDSYAVYLTTRFYGGTVRPVRSARQN